MMSLLATIVLAAHEITSRKEQIKESESVTILQNGVLHEHKTSHEVMRYKDFYLLSNGKKVVRVNKQSSLSSLLRAERILSV